MCGSKSLAHAGNRTPAVQPLADLNKDWAIPNPPKAFEKFNCKFHH
jgi:hypothetical protein